MVSAYREGRLVQGALRSLGAVEPDAIIIYEGPAGKVPDGIEQAPESEFGPFHVTTGRWRSDARKRNAMLEEAKKTFLGAGPVWGVWVDGDEVLVGGEYLRDILQSVLWNDQLEPGEPPTIRWPLRTVQADGSLAITTGRLVRLDLIRSYDISVSVVTNVYGAEERMGNVDDSSKLWLDLWMQAIDAGKMIAWPPLPGEPHLVHRSHLRHPARRGYRMHHQERETLIEAGKLKP